MNESRLKEIEQSTNYDRPIEVRAVVHELIEAFRESQAMLKMLKKSTDKQTALIIQLQEKEAELRRVVTEVANQPGLGFAGYFTHIARKAITGKEA